MAEPMCLTQAIPVCEKLFMKKRNDFVLTNLLDGKVGSEALLQEVQRWSLHPGNKV